jgi:hypothetical protein
VAWAGERNERFTERRGGQDVEKRKKRVIQRAARRAWHQQEKETRDSASGTAGEALKGEETSGSASSVTDVSSAEGRNERFSEQHGGRVVGVRNERAIQRVARRARCGREKETSDSASGTVGV